MAQSTDDSIKQVLAALEVFSGKPDRESLDKANTWLQNFQHLVTHDLHQLDTSQRAGLRDTLLAALRQYAAGPRPVLIQICLALSGLALQMKEWDNAVMDIVNGLGQDPTTVPALLQLLTVLPEEVTSNTRIPMSSDEYRYQEARLLTANAGEVLKLLTMYSQAVGVTPVVQGQIFKCIKSWLQTGEVTPSMITDTPLFQITFDGLEYDELFESVVDVICGLIHETQEIDDNMPVIQAILPRLVALRPKLTAAVRAEDSDTVRGLCRIFTEAGETYRLLLLQHPETFFPIVEAIGECATFTDLDIVPITFHFWFRLAQSIGKKPDVPPVFLDAYRALMDVIIKHLHFPASAEAMSAQERDEFRGFRHVMGDTLKDCCYVLGTDGCLLRTYEMITEALERGSTGTGAVSWQDIEAPLFSMRSMGAEVNPDDDEVLPKIMDLIPKLPAHPRVRYAAIMVISRYTEWTDRHPSYIPFQLSYISAGFEDPDIEVSAAAGQAMKYMCKDCRQASRQCTPLAQKLISSFNQHLVPYLPQLHTFVQTMGPKLIQDDRLQVYEAIGYVITSMPMQEAGTTLRTFSLDLLAQVHSVVEKPSAQKEELQRVADALELLEALLMIVQSFGEELPTACHGTAAEVYPILDALIAKYGTHYFVSERVCRVLRQGLQFFGASALPLAPTVLRRAATSFQSTGYSSFLWLQAKVIAVHGSSPDPTLQLAISETYELSSAQVFAMLKIQAPADMPDVIEDYLHLMLQLLELRPEYLILSPSFASSFQVAITALTLVHPDIIFPALDLVRSLIAHDSLNPTPAPSPRPSPIPGQTASFAQFAIVIRQVVRDNGFQLVGFILAGLLTHFPEDALPVVVSMFRMLAVTWPNELATWLPPVVEQLSVASLPVAAKGQFLDDFARALSSGNVDQVKQAVVALNRAARRARERTRDLVA
ncbi:Nuclear import receptor [Tulasnella sp. 403]|nr:Nuclear import receptor [Tulasnella sp. 403]